LKKKKEIPFFFRERLRMRDKMETDEGREIYRWRKITVEPVIGQIKENLGFRQFCLRELEGAKIEINIVSIVHNLKKIWRGIEGIQREKEKIRRNTRRDYVQIQNINIFMTIKFDYGTASAVMCFFCKKKCRRLS
jgi:hypothetical protein